jgi:GDP-D-mannose 3',5'-epimerase
LIATPIRLGTSELVSIKQLVDYIEEIGEVKLKRIYILDAPLGVTGRNSDNSFIQQELNWEPSLPLKIGLQSTYTRIQQQYFDQAAGKKVIPDSI